MSLHVYGIRRHGPGCARSLLAALTELQPDIVLVEGPPDAQGVLALLPHEGMRPPVALLVYPPDSPQRAVYYPFASFSPEWQALSYAIRRGVPVRFMDLPQSICLAEGYERSDGRTTDAEPARASDGSEDGRTWTDPSLEEDPIGRLAEAAGYTDHELWWEHQIEQRQDQTDLFLGILEAMGALRERHPLPQGHEARREAHMRQVIRAAQKEGYNRIAVVCGAWHAPALASLGPAKPDADLLRGLSKVRVETTWIPWTNDRLSYRSGYGAGVASPGWYEHLWTAPDRVSVRWVAHAARLLRGEDLDASSANVIETVRLAETLAALRGLPVPGLAELQEAMQAVLCGGEQGSMRLIRDRLEVGDRLGEVPEETPSVPLQRDLEALQRRLRLKPSVESKSLDLDLRNENDLARSRLLHRLRLLDIPWGNPQRVRGKSGTFHELWQLQWHPEFPVALIEANVWGNTVESAAAARVRHLSETAPDLPRLTELLDAAALADLPDAVEHLLARVQQQAAVSVDVPHLMAALPPLARVGRYGDVRRTRGDRVLPVIDGLFERILVGLPGACASLDDGAARKLADGIGAVQESVNLLDRAEQRGEWWRALEFLAHRESIHPLVRGWCCRLLLDGGAMDPNELQRLARLALSRAVPPMQAAAWVEGVLRGSGLVLLQQDGLWLALDRWLSELEGGVFVEMLPLVRRAFSGFQPPERRSMGEKVARLHAGSGGPRPIAGDDGAAGIDRERADLVLPVLASILGVRLNVDG